MRGLIVLGKLLASATMLYWSILPLFFSAAVLLVNILLVAKNQGANAALVFFGKSILSAELILRENTMLAVENSPSYGLNAFMQIFSSLIILFYVIYGLDWIMRQLLGKDIPRVGTLVLALGILFIVEFSTAWAMTGSASFVPVKDGIIYAIVHVEDVFGNLHLFGYQIFGGVNDYLNETFNSTQNLTDMLSAGNATIQ